MVVPVQRGFARLSLRFCLQGAESLLSPIRLAQSSLVVPVRTKKRFVFPPRAKTKYTTPQERERKIKAQGTVIPHEELERPITLACTASIFDPYIPPEGDARLSSLSKETLKQRTTQLKQSTISQLAVRTVKQYDPNFSAKAFPEMAQEIFIEAHNCLTNFNKNKLHSLVTERCYPEMVHGNRYKTIRWSFVESLEPPRTVQIRHFTMVNKGNLYGQVTVRMHTRQTLAIYDRFGRLMYGAEDVPKDVLEYVVFERHLVNPYGSWRIHGKIVPSWAPPKDPVIKTVMIPGPALDPLQEFDELQHEIPKPEQIQQYK
ncbi:PREDICTED: 39S ribosomal protein L45, mitochondrial isoform X2 [Crocodylus porosus]|uniref:Large ribosomal subunit protein mL45 n=1 Tax=Crocodylus porosus TaxID=8502 RepID=A0A7M4FRW9_CROPO|nr:PREDICTED: 39S ribosomal protein L45, mitochondrial isoform X2 [Crocodylus porosus]